MPAPSPACSRPDFQRAPGAPALPATPLRFILHFVARYRGWYLAMLAMETLNAGCGILVPYALSSIVKTVAGTPGGPAATAALIEPALMLFVAFSVGEVVFGRLAGAIQIRLGPRQRQQVTRSVYHYLQHHSHRYLTSNFAGALAHRISETSMGVTQTLWSLITEFWPIAIILGVSTALLFHAHVQLGSFVLLWGIGFIGASWLLARRCQPYALKASAARSETTGTVVDSVTNLTSARLFARLGFERQNLESDLVKEMKAIRLSNGYAERVRWFQFSAAAALKIGLLFFSLRLWGQGLINVGDFVMAVSLSLLIINEARNLSRRFLEFFEYVGNVANGVHTIVRPHELIDGPGAAPATLTQGRIAFRHVRFGYTADRLVFDDLNVDIPSGQSVGLVGLSGSGKSSFVSLLLRLHDVQGGVICIDGHDIKALTQDSLHAQIGLIPQEPSLFHRSLRENIRYGRLEASDAEVVEAARRAQAHAFIERIPEGYDSMVGERGVKLSGGQRQRIAIARVILKDAPILILDEATSALDSITERAIQATLDEAMHGKTVIVVAHRLSTVAHLDRILVFDAGRIVEDGSHAQLLARQGAYWRLWRRQTDGFLADADADATAEAVRAAVLHVASPAHDAPSHDTGPAVRGAARIDDDVREPSVHSVADDPRASAQA
jgi:ATP-binding cassette subfamily B protein